MDPGSIEDFVGGRFSSVIMVDGRSINAHNEVDNTIALDDSNGWCVALDGDWYHWLGGLPLTGKNCVPYHPDHPCYPGSVYESQHKAVGIGRQETETMYDDNDIPRENTAARARYDGERLGLFGEALDLFVKAGASARHERRVGLALDALLCEGERVIGGNGPTSRAAALLIGLLDINATGGRLKAGLGNPGTLRIACLQHLGKGRRQASDGAAWDSAIREAVRKLENELKAEWVRPSPHDQWRWRVDRREGLEPLDFNIPNDDQTFALLFEHAAARRAIAYLGGYPHQREWSLMQPLPEDAMAWALIMQETAPPPEPSVWDDPVTVQAPPLRYSGDDPDDDVEVIKRYCADVDDPDEDPDVRLDRETFTGPENVS